MRIVALTLAATLVLACGPAWSAAAANDGFAAFWTQFTAALAKNDKLAAAAMMQPDTLGNGPGESRTAAEYYTRNFTPAARRCLLKKKPDRDAHDGTVTYAVFCGEQIFVFEKKAGVWKFTDIGAND
jgi:hypothetical protein